MDQSIHRHNTISGSGYEERLGAISGGEFSVFAMNRGRQRFIDILQTWENAKLKKKERKERDLEKEKLVSFYLFISIDIRGFTQIFTRR